MSRPSYRTGEKTARERMEDAFWQCLEEGPYAQITVARIVGLAGVNRNSFYYHFENIDDMAENAIAGLLAPHAIHKVLVEFGAVDAAILEEFSGEGGIRLDRIGLIAGDHSSTALRGMLRTAVVETYGSALGIDVDALSVPDRAFIEFMLGGVLSVLAYRMTCAERPTVADVLDTEWYEAGIANMRAFAERNKA